MDGSDLSTFQPLNPSIATPNPKRAVFSVPDLRRKENRGQCRRPPFSEYHGSHGMACRGGSRWILVPGTEFRRSQRWRRRRRDVTYHRRAPSRSCLRRRSQDLGEVGAKALCLDRGKPRRYCDNGKVIEVDFSKSLDSIRPSIFQQPWWLGDIETTMVTWGSILGNVHMIQLLTTTRTSLGDLSIALIGSLPSPCQAKTPRCRMKIYASRNDPLMVGTTITDYHNQ